MSKKKKIIIGILLVSFIIIITGVSYAIWQMNLEQNSTNVITSSCFKIELQDNNPINIQSAYPISDEEGSILTPYTFTIKNTCESYASYQINLEILNTTTLENVSFLKVMLEDKSLLSELEDTSKTLENAKSSKKIETGYLDRNQEKTFELRIWLDENTPTNEEFMNKIFESKITVISSYISEFDREEPIASFEVTKTEEELIIDASGSYDEMSNIKNYYYSRDGINYEKSKSSSYTFKIDENIKYGKGTEALHLFAESTASEIYVKVEDEFGNISSVHKKTLGELAFDNTEDNNLRYIGSNPNNYVSFNNELWRIIGVMNNIEDGNGEKSSRIKIIRDKSIGAFSWDSSTSNINDGRGINEWSQADIMKLLNPGFESESVGGSLFWNKQSGTCYNNKNNGTKNCDFRNTGLNDFAKSFIDTVIWKIGSNTKETYNNVNAFKFYEFERGSFTGKSCSNTIYCNDTVERTTTWIGNVGLPHPSDYGFATNGGTETKRDLCLNTLLYDWDSFKDCYQNNWLYNSQQYQWTINPGNSNEGRNYYISIIRTHGGVSSGAWAYCGYLVLPTLYLKSNVQIINGDGSFNNPFVLSI